MIVVCMIPSVNADLHIHMRVPLVDMSDPLLDMSDTSYNNGHMIGLPVLFLNVAL